MVNKKVPHYDQYMLEGVNNCVEKVDPLITARASLMNNLKKALVKRKKD